MRQRACRQAARRERPGVEPRAGAAGAAGERAGAAAEAAQAIAAYAPTSLSAPAGAFARAVVGRAEPKTPARAKALLYAASRLARFAEAVGLEPSPELLLERSTIERFIAVGCRTVSPATRRTLATNLRALQRALEADRGPAPVALPRERAKLPYGEAEIAGYLRLAAAQPTEARRMRAAALVCLGAGAGLIGAELRHLRGRDVHRRCGGLVVVVGGARARSVPVLARFHEQLRAAAAFAADGYLIGGSAPARKNLTDALSAALCRDAGLPRLEAGRLRATWLVSCAQLIGLAAFMRAAGVRCTQRLGDLVDHLPAVAEAEAVALLGGADERLEGAPPA